MKKISIIMGVSIVLAASSAFGAVGKIIKISVRSDDTARVVLHPSDAGKANLPCTVDLTTASGKAMLAVALSGKAGKNRVNITKDGRECSVITLLP